LPVLRSVNSVLTTFLFNKRRATMARLKISDFYPSIIYFLSPLAARRSSGGQYAKEPF
jgi:hypothetical protein